MNFVRNILMEADIETLLAANQNYRLKKQLKNLKMFLSYIRMILKSVTGFFSFLFIIFCFSCRQPAIEPKKPVNDLEKEALIKANINLVKQDAVRIEAYAKRRNLNAKVTDSGLWYCITKKGNGKKARAGLQANIKYNLSLLDGTFCYTSDSTGNKKFTIGAGNVEAGLEEAILLMAVGDRANIIIPPHLAYGILGDQNCIGPRAILVYDIEIVDIK
jgi:FKBP-type peptidyl-prolyl cis-trans isomerase